MMKRMQNRIYRAGPRIKMNFLKWISRNLRIRNEWELNKKKLEKDRENVLVRVKMEIQMIVQRPV